MNNETGGIQEEANVLWCEVLFVLLFAYSYWKLVMV
jgi:hypothetical protein